MDKTKIANRQQFFHHWTEQLKDHGGLWLLRFIEKSTSRVLVNWSIIEELERLGQSKVIYCPWDQFLFCWHIYKKSDSDIVLISDESQQLQKFIVPQEGRVFSSQSLTEQMTSFDSAKFLTQAGKTLWIPFRDNHLLPEIKILSNLIDNTSIPIIPMYFATASGLMHSLPNGLHYPYPFSKITLFVGTPIIKRTHASPKKLTLQLTTELNHLKNLTQALL